MTPEPDGQSVNPIEENLRSSLRALEGIKSHKRSRQMGKLVELSMSNADRLFSTIQMLSTSLKSEPYAEKLAEMLSDNDRILKRCNDKAFLMGVLSSINGPNKERVEGVIVDLFLRPSKVYNEGNRASVENSFSASSNALYNFLNATINLNVLNEESSRAAESAIKRVAKLQIASLTGGKEFYFTIIDFTYIAAVVSTDEVSEKAIIATRVLDYLLRKYAPEDGEQIVAYMNAVDNEKPDKVKAYEALIGKQKTKRSFQATRFYKLTEDIAQMPELMEKGEYYHVKASDFTTFKNVRPGFSFYYTDPGKLELGEKYTLIIMIEAESVLRGDDYETEILLLPSGGLAIAALDKKKYGEGTIKKVVAETLIKYHPGDMNPLDNGGFESIVKYFGPEFDHQKTMERQAQLLERVQTGWFALTERGDKVIFEDKEEAWIREIGVESILFRQKGGQIDVTVKWHSWEIKFSFDRNYGVEGLEGLTDEYKDWLVTFVLSYLAEIKNPEKKPTVTVGKSENILKTEDEPQKPWGRRAHLRVNHVGDTGKIDTESKEKVRFHFGIDLEKLNYLFAMIQKRLTPSRVLFSGVSPQVKIVYERFLWVALKRIRAREEKPRWDKEGDEELTMTLKNPIVGVKPNYTISFVKEAAIQPNKLKPMLIECPGVAKEILELSKAEAQSLS